MAPMILIDLTGDSDDNGNRVKATVGPVVIKREPSEKAASASDDAPHVTSGGQVQDDTGRTPVQDEADDDRLAPGPEEIAPASPSADVNPDLMSTATQSSEEQARDHQAIEALLQANLGQFHASMVRNEPLSKSTTGHNTPMPSPSPAEDESEGALAAAQFEKMKRRYERRKGRSETTFSEDVEYKKACKAMETRARLKKRKLDHTEREAQNDAQEDGGMFCSDTEHTPQAGGTDFPSISPDGDDMSTALKRKKPNRANKIPALLLEESMRVGFDASTDRNKKQGPNNTRKRKDLVKKVSGDKVTKPKTKKDSAPKKKGRLRKGPEISNIDSLLNHDTIAVAQANRDQPDQPTFTSHTRKDALKELIASIPADQRKLYGADTNALNKACRSFSGVQSIKARGEDGWCLKGMKSHLRSYQLLGASFMRDRENSGNRPFGGIQSDDMGLGKTVMMIANILDGKASDRSPNRTTLIVCPSALTSQWMNEIIKHTERNALGDVIVYRSGTRILSADPVKTLSSMDVVITTYQEVLRSYPYCEAPLHVVSEQAKREWWQAHYEKNRGHLHKVFFRRIVLDEAQCIKNHLSKTSIAVRGLSAKYRWCLSGTPIQNSLSEFYPYFAFLKVEHTGSYDLFMRNFCKKNSSVARERLSAFLQKIMCRRTHLDKLFGRPLLKLPNINRQTIEVEFNDVERAIYRIIRTRFINRIRAYAKADTVDKKYQQVFGLLLRLRQLTGHILLIQKTLNELLESEDLERLWKLTDCEQKPGEEGHDMLKMLQQGLATAQANSNANPETNDSPASTVEENQDDRADAGGHGPAFKFRRYLTTLRENGSWERIAQQSMCHACDSIPTNPHITSCMHVYCFACLQGLSYAAAQQEQTRARCIECGTEYEKVEPCRAFEEAANEVGSPASVHSAICKRKKKATNEDEDADWFTVGGPMLQSAKTKAATAQMAEWRAEDPDAKIIVFTQFLGMLKVMSRTCIEKDWGYTTFHGGMTFDARDQAIQDFSTDPETKILLASMRAGGVGLNLTAASRVIIIDLWWNEAVEMQAFCRVFRIGQTRDVELRRFVVKDSIDMDILKMQERKNEEIRVSTERRKTQLNTVELLRLFGPLATDDNGEIIADGEDEPFILVEDPYEAHDSDSDVEEIPRTITAPPF